MICAMPTAAQTYNQMDESGNITQRSDNDRFSRNDTTKNNKEVPKGIHVWTIDRKFGDIKPAEVDTMPHLYPNTTLVNGKYGEYNTIGNNYSPRINRIVIDRPLASQFIFTQPYDYVMKEPDNLRFTNTLSPYTNISYDNCGDKTNGEDHIDALFAVNAGKKFGAGFDLNYSYARGYYANQSISHFGATLFASYLGDRYQMHTMFSTYHQKESLNGGITDDTYITHPETIEESFATDEIPTVLEQNWQRNNNVHFFLTHRYSLGFYRQVKMTDEEIKARKFAAESKKEKQQRELDAKAQGKEEQEKLSSRSGRKREMAQNAPTGRPDNAQIAGDEPAVDKKPIADDSTRVKIGSQAELDSINRAKAIQDSIDATMKKEYVPVTSFIHTLDLNSYDRIYQSYVSPADYYANSYYDLNCDNAYSGDSIFDQTKMFQLKNTFAIALFEGFNKYVKAGLKVFASHELRKMQMPDLAEDNSTAIWNKWTEHNVSIGGQLRKSQGNTLHFDLMAETWLAGEDAGQLKIDFSTDLNFRFLGDTVTLAAKAYLYRLTPTFYQRRYHSKHIWWDNDWSKETRTRIEGLFSYRKTHTSLRVAIEEMQNYTYFGVAYGATTSGRTGMTTTVSQASGNINLMTLQLRQDFRLGILNWENIITYQNSSDQGVLPVPNLNIFTNLYLKFKLVKELAVELGASGYYFTKYYAPDYSPQLSQFAVQQNGDSNIKIGGYPFVDVYANFHLKRTRFFLMFTHVNAGSGSKEYFLAPHYAQNERVMRFGVSWNFFN